MKFPLPQSQMTGFSDIGLCLILPLNSLLDHLNHFFFIVDNNFNRDEINSFLANKSRCVNKYRDGPICRVGSKLDTFPLGSITKLKRKVRCFSVKHPIQNDNGKNKKISFKENTDHIKAGEKTKMNSITAKCTLSKLQAARNWIRKDIILCQGRLESSSNHVEGMFMVNTYLLKKFVVR